MRLICRADAAPRVGAGHVMRSLALAQGAKERGFDVCMLGRIQIPWLGDRLAGEEISILKLADNIPLAENPKNLLAQVAKTGFKPDETWVALDGYHFSLAAQQALRKAGYSLLVIDDYAHLPQYSCDLLLNQNPGSDPLNYRGDIGAKFMGPHYALLRKEFRLARQKQSQNTKNRHTAKNILISLGGGNFVEYLAAIARGIRIPEIAGCNVRIVQGAMNGEEIRETFKNMRANLEILPCINDMPSVLLDTDLCITAGGSTCWELCCLGVPFLTVAMAENQQGICAWLEANGIAPIFDGRAFAKALITCESKDNLRDIADGDGALRVIAFMAGQGLSTVGEI